jgi:hypothetical protein
MLRRFIFGTLFLVGIVFLPLRAAAATVRMLFAYDAACVPTATMPGTLLIERREAERPAINDYDSAQIRYSDLSKRPVARGAAAVHAYDGALKITERREPSEGVIYAAPAATTAAEGAAGAAARFATTAERTGVLEKVLTSEGTLNTSQTVARQLAGQRGFIPVQSILDTIGSGARVADPQGVAGQFMYRAGAAFNGSAGTLEVLVDEASGQINHVLFRSGVSP